MKEPSIGLLTFSAVTCGIFTQGHAHAVALLKNVKTDKHEWLIENILGTSSEWSCRKALPAGCVVWLINQLPRRNIQWVSAVIKIDLSGQSGKCMGMVLSFMEQDWKNLGRIRNSPHQTQKERTGDSAVPGSIPRPLFSRGMRICYVLPSIRPRRASSLTYHGSSCETLQRVCS